MGNKAETLTEVEVGIDYSTRKSLLNIRKEIHGLKFTLKSCEKELKILNEIKHAKGGLPEKHIKKYESLLFQNGELNNKLKELIDKENNILKKITVNKNAKVKVNKTVYPGAIIKIGEHIMPVLNEHHDKTFFFSEAERTIKMI